MDEAKEALQAASKAVRHADTELWAEMRPLDRGGWDDARQLKYGQATMTKVMDELHATVQPPVLVIWAELASGELRRSTGARLALGAFLLASELAAGPFKLATDPFTERTDKTIRSLLKLAGDHLADSLFWFDSPRLAKDADDGGLIGARPSAGPGFHDPGAAQREQAVQEMLSQRAVAFTAAVATEPPYGDLREPWLHRMLRRARPGAGSQ
jgi:hypothetical protein